MRIELASLEGGKGQFAHNYAGGELVLEDGRVRLLSPPQVSGELRTKERRVRANGRVVAQVQVECDRCLKPIELPVDSRFKLEYISVEDYKSQQEDELSVDDLDLTVFDGEVIDVDELVAEELLLAVPDHLLCKDDCKGLCPVCGVDRNTSECGCDTAEVDPRWAGLKELVNRE
ncbi:MAG: DUF177 domain-containing protein [Acidobacteriota bacterium]